MSLERILRYKVPFRDGIPSLSGEKTENFAYGQLVTSAEFPPFFDGKSAENHQKMSTERKTTRTPTDCP